jgi:uncharacterized membrane protein YvlD (DUF360 family)
MTYLKKLFTFTITACLLGISFAIVYGLSVQQNSDTTNGKLAIVISIVISIVNVMLARILSLM